MKILLVEEDERTANVISDALTAYHYLVNITKDAQTGLALSKAYSYDLILLDVIVPGLDSVSLCRQMRAEGAQMPILMLTGKSKSGDRIAGLEAGADDYMVKPFDVAELVARIRALLRRRSAALQTLLTWEKLQINLDACEVIYDKGPIHLTPKEYGLLELFLRNPRRIFNRSALLDNVWKADEFPGERAVTTQIKGLRQKLKTAGMKIDCLETVYGLGYRLKPQPIDRLEQDPLEQDPSEQKQETLSASPQPQTALNDVEAAIEKVWQKLKETFSKTFALFDQICTQAIAAHQVFAEYPENPIQTVDPELLQNAILEAHRLAGNLGTFGLPEGSELARHIEQLLRASALPSLGETQQLAEWVAKLKQVVTQQRNSQKSQKSQPLPQAYQPARAHPTRLLVVDDDVAMTQHIQAVAQQTGFEVAVVTNLNHARAVSARMPFDAILLDLSFPDTAENGLTFLKELTHQTPEIPVLVLTGRDQLSNRIEVARLGGRAFVQKPISPQKLLETVVQVLSQKQEVVHRVLVVDDDPRLLETVTLLLEPWGLQVTTLDDAQRFWEILEMSAPHLLILDIAMPHFNGIELCQAVRNDPDWGESPILFLTARRDADTVQHVFMAGADDYVSKPIMAPELLARVLNCLERGQQRGSRRHPQTSMQPKDFSVSETH